VARAAPARPQPFSRDEILLLDRRLRSTFRWSPTHAGLSCAWSEGW